VQLGIGPTREPRSQFKRIRSEALDIVGGLLALPFILMLLAAVPVFALISKVTGWGAAAKWTKAEVAKALEDFVNNEGGEWDWDDFISVPIADQELDKVRQFCEEARTRWPVPEGQGWCNDEGMDQIRQLAARLRSEVATESLTIDAPATQR